MSITVSIDLQKPPKRHDAEALQVCVCGNDMAGKNVSAEFSLHVIIYCCSVVKSLFHYVFCCDLLLLRVAIGLFICCQNEAKHKIS